MSLGKILGGDSPLDKAKDLLGNISDDQIDDVAEKIKDHTPDAVDNLVDKGADALKKLN